MKVVVVQPRQRVPRPLLELGEGRRLLHLDARIKRIRILGIAKQTNVVLQPRQPRGAWTPSPPRANPASPRARGSVAAEETLLGGEFRFESIRRRRAAVGRSARPVSCKNRPATSPSRSPKTSRSVAAVMCGSHRRSMNQSPRASSSRVVGWERRVGTVPMRPTRACAGSSQMRKNPRT